MIKRKKDLKLKYSAIYNICSTGDNFFTNMYKVIKMIANYQEIVSTEKDDLSKAKSKTIRESTLSIGALKKIKKRG